MYEGVLFGRYEVDRSCRKNKIKWQKEGKVTNRLIWRQKSKKLKGNMYFKIATVFTSFFIPKTREEEEQREKTELFMGENKVKHFVNIL